MEVHINNSENESNPVEVHEEENNRHGPILGGEERGEL